jgi:hypothetical protein
MDKDKSINSSRDRRLMNWSNQSNAQNNLGFKQAKDTETSQDQKLRNEDSQSRLDQDSNFSSAVNDKINSTHLKTRKDKNDKT